MIQKVLDRLPRHWPTKLPICPLEGDFPLSPSQEPPEPPRPPVLDLIRLDPKGNLLAGRSWYHRTLERGGARLGSIVWKLTDLNEKIFVNSHKAIRLVVMERERLGSARPKQSRRTAFGFVDFETGALFGLFGHTYPEAERDLQTAIRLTRTMAKLPIAEEDLIGPAWECNTGQWAIDIIRFRNEKTVYGVVRAWGEAYCMLGSPYAVDPRRIEQVWLWGAWQAWLALPGRVYRKRAGIFRPCEP